MTQEEIDDLQVGDIYINDRQGLDNKPRIITSRNVWGVTYAHEDGITNDCFWNGLDQLLRPEYKIIKSRTMFDIKPGMILIDGKDITADNAWVVFPSKNSPNGLCAVKFSVASWTMTVDTKSMVVCANKIYFVLDEVTGGNLISGKILWKRLDTVEKTIAEIEKELDIAPGTLRIKKE